MRVRPSPFLLWSCAAAFVACSHNPQSAAPAPQPAAGQAVAPAQSSLAGDWVVALMVQTQNAGGTLRLRQAGDGGYNGFLQLEGANQPYAVRSVRTEGLHFIIILDADDGEARIEGNLRGQMRFDALYSSRHTSGRLSGSKQ